MGTCYLLAFLFMENMYLWFVRDISGGGDGVVQDICDGGPQHVHGEVAEAGEDQEPDHRPGPRLGLGSIAQTWTHQQTVALGVIMVSDCCI